MGFETPTIEDTTTNALFWGASGSGKTTGAGTACSPGVVDVAVLNTEAGGWQSITHGLGYTPQVWNIKAWDDIKKAAAEIEDGKHPWIKTLIVDSVTDLKAVAQREAMKRGRRRPDGPNVPSMGDHGEVSVLMSDMLRRLRDLPVNVIFVTLVKDKIETGEINGKEVRKVVGQVPDLPGQLADLMPALVDVSIFCNATEVEVSAEYPTGVRYMGQTVPGKGRACKVRGGVLPPVIDLHWSTIAAAYGRPEGLLAGQVPLQEPVAVPDAAPAAEDEQAPPDGETPEAAPVVNDEADVPEAEPVA